jgi:hypothetical protein
MKCSLFDFRADPRRSETQPNFGFIQRHWLTSSEPKQRTNYLLIPLHVLYLREKKFGLKPIPPQSEIRDVSYESENEIMQNILSVTIAFRIAKHAPSGEIHRWNCIAREERLHFDKNGNEYKNTPSNSYSFEWNLGRLCPILAKRFVNNPIRDESSKQYGGVNFR